jgi:AraC-like DNA-binding protein
MKDWVPVRSVGDFAELRNSSPMSSAHWWPEIRPMGEPASFSFIHRVRRLGPITLLELHFHDDVLVDGGVRRPHYHITMPVAKSPSPGNCGVSLVTKPGSVMVYRPEGDAISSYVGGLLVVMIDRHALEDALADALGRSITSQIDCKPIMATTSQAVRNWMTMVSLFAEQLFQAGSTLHQPMVGMPFVESLIHGLLLATEHPYRAALEGQPQNLGPRAIRDAMDMIEAEADQPLTVSVLAERNYVSVRSLQKGFREHLGVTPMAYLRQVRLRRAHQMLLDSDPSRVTVASVASRWGFTNVGRFAAAHTARYQESPSKTLRRSG